jgi:predicted nucleic acid-binding protein
LLIQNKKQLVFLQTVQDLLLSDSVQIVRLEANDMQNVIDASQQFNLDFDDAYQYAAAQKYNLTIVSFDSDFDRTVRGRRTPGDSVDK